MGAFNKIDEMSLSNGRAVVISRMGDGKYTIAQKIEVEDANNPGRTQAIFLKNSIVASPDDLEILYGMIGKIIDEN